MPIKKRKPPKKKVARKTRKKAVKKTIKRRASPKPRRAQPKPPMIELPAETMVVKVPVEGSLEVPTVIPPVTEELIEPADIEEAKTEAEDMLEDEEEETEDEPGEELR